MRRWLLNFLAVLSLPIFLGAMGAWVYSYWSGYHIAVRVIGSERGGGTERALFLITGQGHAYVSISKQGDALATDPSVEGDAVWHPMFYHSCADRSLARDAARSAGLTGAFRYAHSFDRMSDELYWSTRYVAFPLWLVPIPFSLFPIVWLRRAVVVRRRVKRGGCTACGYDLRASPVRCPECGTSVYAGRPRATRGARWRRASPIVAAMIFCLCVSAALTIAGRSYWRHQQQISDRSAADRSLWEAIGRDDIAGVRAALAAGVNADLHVRGWSTLTWAGERRCHSALLRLLVESGANVNFTDFDGKSPLYFAMEASDIRLVQLMLEHGADPNFRIDRGVMGWVPLILMANYQSSEMVELLLDHGADVNAQMKSGSLLSYELERENWTTVKMLLKRGAKAPAADLDNGLKLARKRGERDAAQLLLKAGAKE